MPHESGFLVSVWAKQEVGKGLRQDSTTEALRRSSGNSVFAQSFGPRYRRLFRLPKAIQLAQIPEHVAAADFNGDGTTDLAICNFGAPTAGDDGSVSLLLGKGAGAFQPATNFTAVKNCTDLVTGDFDSDGPPTCSWSVRVIQTSRTMATGARCPPRSWCAHWQSCVTTVCRMTTTLHLARRSCLSRKWPQATHSGRMP